MFYSRSSLGKNQLDMNPNNSFVFQPDEMFGEHLEKRLKQMASDMIEACGKRYRGKNSL